MGDDPVERPDDDVSDAAIERSGPHVVVPPRPALTPTPLPPQQPGQVGVALQIGAQSTEALAIQRLSPEGVADALKRAHELEERKLEAQDRQLEREAVAEEKDNQRQHDLTLLREKRRWGMLYAVFGGIVAFVSAVFWREGGQGALEAMKTLGAPLLAIMGGIGIEKMRREWSGRR